MNSAHLIDALQSLSVETGSLACLGCGHEHNCSIHGCAIIRAAGDRIAELLELDSVRADQCAKLLERVAELEAESRAAQNDFNRLNDLFLRHTAMLERRLETQANKAATDAEKLINEMERYKHLCNTISAQLTASQQRERAAVEALRLSIANHSVDERQITRLMQHYLAEASGHQEAGEGIHG